MFVLFSSNVSYYVYSKEHPKSESCCIKCNLRLCQTEAWWVHVYICVNRFLCTCRGRKRRRLRVCVNKLLCKYLFCGHFLITTFFYLNTDLFRSPIPITALCIWVTSLFSDNILQSSWSNVAELRLSGWWLVAGLLQQSECGFLFQVWVTGFYSILKSWASAYPGNWHQSRWGHSFCPYFVFWQKSCRPLTLWGFAKLSFFSAFILIFLCEIIWLHSSPPF